MIYEQLQQWQKATEVYLRVIDRKKELTGAISSPSLVSLIDMANWRNDYIAWMEKAKTANQSFRPGGTNNSAPVAAR